MQRYHWKVLPQGMANSPTLCQKFVVAAIAGTRTAFPEAYVILYMDDILLAHEDPVLLRDIYASLQEQLQQHELILAPEKAQQTAPYNYLGKVTEGQKIKPQKFQFRTDHLQTLNDFQKLLGDKIG